MRCTSHPGRPARCAGLAVLLFFAGPSQRAAAAEDLSVSARSVGPVVAIDARATIRAPLRLIWETLTDYDHLASFIPGITSSRVIGRQGDRTLIAQSGVADILFFKYPIEIVGESTPRPPFAIDLRLVSGNLRRLDGHYRIDPVGAGDERYVLRWNGLIEPSIALPGVIELPLLRANVSDQFAGMVKEIERRAAAAAASGVVD